MWGLELKEEDGVGPQALGVSARRVSNDLKPQEEHRTQGDRVKGEVGNLPHLGGSEKLLLLGPPQLPPDGCDETERGLCSHSRLWPRQHFNPVIGCQNPKLASGFLGPQGDLQFGPRVPFPLLRVQGAVSAAGPALGFIQEISRHVHRGPGLARHQRHGQVPGPASTSAASNKHLFSACSIRPRASSVEQSGAEVRVTPEETGSARGGGSGA